MYKSGDDNAICGDMGSRGTQRAMILGGCCYSLILLNNFDYGLVRMSKILFDYMNP